MSRVTALERRPPGHRVDRRRARRRGEGAAGRCTAGAWTRAEYAQDAFRAALVHAARAFGG